MGKICQYEGCNIDISWRAKNAKYCTIHAKAGYRQHRKEYMKKYNKLPEVKQRKREFDQRRREQQREQKPRPEEREKAKEYMKKYNQLPEVKQRRRERNKLGNTEIIIHICKEHGISDEIATAIALDGKVLDRKMREGGMLI